MNNSLKYFLAANSGEGFVSCFEDCYRPYDGWRAYIIKGGPGTGKSSFMKHLAATADSRGFKTELCPCSSDPDSLDALILPELKVAFTDGTAPHTLDPKFPGVCEEILNFGDFWDSYRLSERREEILRLTEINRTLHKSASRYIKAAGIITADSLKAAEYYTDTAKAASFADRLCKQLIPKKAICSVGYEQSRFLCGFTPRGTVSFAENAFTSVENGIIIKDSTGAASNIIMNRIKKLALGNGYRVISVKNPLLPSQLCDHIILPELSLGFFREYDLQLFSSKARRIHARRFTCVQLNKNRERLRFNKKASSELLLEATSVLNQAKAVHDLLEDQYISAMSFEKQNQLAERLGKELFGE